MSCVIALRQLFSNKIINPTHDKAIFYYDFILLIFKLIKNIINLILLMLLVKLKLLTRFVK